MAICLALFPPSTKFYSYLDGYINKNFQDADWKEVILLLHKWAACTQFLYCSVVGQTTLVMRSTS